MELSDVALPEVFANLSFSLWLPGEWPSFGEAMRPFGKPPYRWEAIQTYFEQRYRSMGLVKAALRATRVPRLTEGVFLAFWHRRVGYDESDRMDYCRGAERTIVPALVWAGAFRENMIRGVTHLFDRAGAGAAGIQVMVAEHQCEEPSTLLDRDGQGLLPGVGARTGPEKSRRKAGNKPDGSRKEAGQGR
jgi:hypothetical protein